MTELLSPEERRDPPRAVAALQQRLLQGKLKPAQVRVLEESLAARMDSADEALLETIRLIMSTPEYQLT